MRAAAFLALLPAASGFATPASRTRRARAGPRMVSDASSPTAEESSADCLVIGAGISGCSLAHSLHRAGADVLLAEARDYVGGNVVTRSDDEGFVWEEGPNGFAVNDFVVRMAYELGIADELVFADASLPPWVNHGGTIHPLPKGKGSDGVKGQLELVFGSNGVLKFGLLGGLLSWPGKLRAAVGLFLGHAPPPAAKEETIREWVTRILGEEVFLRVIDPFVSGVYAGDPQTLAVKAALPKIANIERVSYEEIEGNQFGALFYGGLKRTGEVFKERKANPPPAAWPDFEPGNTGSFRRGLATLPRAVQAELGDGAVRLGWRLEALERDGAAGGGYVARFATPDGPRVVRARSVVSTAPAHALRGVLDGVLPEAAALFSKPRPAIGRDAGIYHPPVAAVTVAYPKSAFRDVELPNGFGPLRELPGFGMLNPRTEGVRTLGTLWSSSLFPGRCPPDYNLLLNYIGGSRDVALGELSEAEIVAEVDKGCRQTLLDAAAPPPKVLAVKVWPTAIPQYELGHAEIIAELERGEAKTPGLWVCGNYRTGVAFPDCVKFGYDHAEKVLRFLDANADGAAAGAPTEPAAREAASPVAA